MLGGSIAGLLAAQALAHRGDEVIVIERDRLPVGPESRPGVPQAAHVHGLVSRGQQEIERLLPGFAAELVQAGAPVVDFAADVAICNPFGWSVRFPSRLKAYGASRSLLESLIRRRVLAHPSVELRSQQFAEGLTGVAGLVTGVRVRGTGGARLSPIMADLVIDATGRGSRAGHWLRELGYPALPEVVIDIQLGYASRCMRIPAGHRADWQACYIQPGAPHRPRGAMLMPIEDDRWLVTLIGIGADRPSRRKNDFLAFARSLASPIVADAIANATPTSPVYLSRSTSSRRRYIEHATAQPANFVLVGDAVCCFNPIYAQGMSTAAAAATLLGEYRETYSSRRDFAACFHRGLAKVNNWAWLLATTSDLKWPGARGPRPTSLQRSVDRYTDLVLSSATRDHKTQQALLDVLHLLRSPTSLMA
ncbi:2-polyprenyl-6-methoxyphenol hydroxylase-like oxidoreductase, partial [Nonomuraea turkmeniaca]